MKMVLINLSNVTIEILKKKSKLLIQFVGNSSNITIELLFLRITR